MAPAHEAVLQANTEAVAALEKRLQVVQQILEEIANELGWVTRNLQDLSITDGGAGHTETVQCMECECERVRGLAEALRRKWTDLMLHEGRYVGLCPACGEDIDGSRAATDERPARNRTITVDAEEFARAMEQVEVLKDSGEELRMTCAECHAIADLPAAEAVQRGGWKEIGETVDGIVGLCPECVNREPPKAPEPSPPVPADHTPSSAAVAASAVRSTKRRAKQQPLYMRMFQDRHMTALVRAVGHAGFPAAESQERLKPLIDEFGEALVRAAADEVVEVDHAQNPPMARLTAEARTVVVGLIGRPPEAPPAASEVPPQEQEDGAAEAVPGEIAKPRRRRKAKGDHDA